MYESMYEWGVSRPTTLYRYFDRRGALLYIGITTAGHARALGHWRTAKWWRRVATATFRHYRNESEARAAEAAAIYDELPLYNVAGHGFGEIWVQTALDTWQEWHERNPDRLALRVEEIAKFVRLHPSTVNERLKSLPHHRLGRLRFVGVEAVPEVIQGLTIGRPL